MYLAIYDFRIAGELYRSQWKMDSLTRAIGFYHRLVESPGMEAVKIYRAASGDAKTWEVVKAWKIA